MPEGERRLAAIMFTDMVGFTSLTQSNESLAMRELGTHSRVLGPIFRRYHGREVKTMGDAFLVEFGSALEATECAIEIQRTLHRNPTRSRLPVRIGIHVGDVIHRKGDVFGDAVNIASRIEPLAAGGEVCISEQVFDQVRNKIPFPLEKVRSPNLKNVTFPIDIFRVKLPWRSKSETEGERLKPSVSLLRSDSVKSRDRRQTMDKFISKLALKDRIVDVRLINDSTIPEALARFSEGVNYGRGETLHLVSAVESVAVVIDSKNLSRLEEFIPAKSVLGITRDLAEVIVSFTERSSGTIGIAATITGELARNGVNILEYITSWDHAIIVVDDSQAMKGYEVLRTLLTKRLPRFPS